MTNDELRDAMKASGIFQWQIAEYLGIGETTLSRKMRSALNDDFRKKIENAIQVLSVSPKCTSRCQNNQR